jgi:hypothetical protein
MAKISTSDGMLGVRLSRREKIAAGRGDLRVPLMAVRDVRVHPDALVAARGGRPPGAGVPGMAKIGISRGRGRRALIVARRGIPAVCLTLDGGRHDEVIVSDPNAESIARDIRGALEVRRGA